MQIKKITDYSKTSGTSYHDDNISATVEELINVFGKVERGNASDKSQFDWNLELSDGTPFTIYVWKEYRYFRTNERIDFHIGGFDKRDTIKARKVIEHLLVNAEDNEFDILTQAN